jgi:hypothetical protein
VLYIYTSFCPEHAWQVRKFDPSKHSIFSLQAEFSEAEEEAAYSQLELKESVELLPNATSSPEHSSRELMSPRQQGSPGNSSREQCSPRHREHCLPGHSSRQQGSPGRSFRSHKSPNKKTLNMKFGRAFTICEGNAGPL